jgi:hypothetical protein
MRLGRVVVRAMDMATFLRSGVGRYDLQADTSLSMYFLLSGM